MFKNSILYRRLWYVKRRNTRRNYILLRIMLIFLVFAFAVFCTERAVLPFLDEVLRQKAAEKINEAAVNALCGKFPEGIKYEELSETIKDDTGNSALLEINYARLNNLSNEISNNVDRRLEEAKEQIVPIPLGNAKGSIFSGSRLELHSLIIPAEKVQTEFDSQFYEEGTKQIRHVITLKVKATVDVKVYIISRRLQIVTHIPVTEAIHQ